MTDKVELIKAKVEEKINLYERLLNAGKGGGAGLMSKIVALQGVLIDINFIQMDSLPEEPVNKVWHDASEEPKEGFTIVVYMKDDSLKVLTSWGENGDFCIGEGFWYNIHQQRKWAYVDDLVNLSDVERTVKDWKEPVSEDLAKAAKENAKIERSDDTEVGYDINRFGGFIDGAKWNRKHILSKIDVNAMLADYQAEVGINNYVQIYSKGIEAVLKKIKEL